MKFNGQKVKIRVWDDEGFIYEFGANSIGTLVNGLYSFGLNLKQSKVIDRLSVESVYLYLDDIDNSPYVTFEGLGKSVDGKRTFLHFSINKRAGGGVW